LTEHSFARCSTLSARTVFDGNEDRWYSGPNLPIRVATCRDGLQFRKKVFGLLFSSNDVASLSVYLAAIEAGHAVATLNRELD
jgi:hypothetical protein